MTEALKTTYDTLTTNLRPPEKTRSYYLDKWKRRQGLFPRGGGRIEKFRRIAKYQRITIQDIVGDALPRVATSEYHFYRWNVGVLLCVYCGVKLDRDNQTQDHAIPKCRGGAQMGPDNLEPSCRTCNWAKGDLSILEFLFMQNAR
jgi:5-methylcytosine-specific restriction endonuclease McrA